MVIVSLQKHIESTSRKEDIEVSRDIIFDENHAYKRSKDIPIDFDDEDIPTFEEEEQHHVNHTTIQEEEDGPSEPIQLVIIPNTRKWPNWLKATLEDAEGHGATKGTFRERKIPKRYSGYVAYIHQEE